MPRRETMELIAAQQALLDLAAMVQPGGDVVPAPDQPATIAHLTQTVRNELGHVRVHMDGAVEAPPGESKEFNLAHASHHADKAIEHAEKLIAALAQYDPKVGAALDNISAATGDQV